MLPSDMYNTMSHKMRILCDDILEREKGAYVLVPILHGQGATWFCIAEDFLLEKFYFDFREIFNMFHLRLGEPLIML